MAILSKGGGDGGATRQAEQQEFDRQNNIRYGTNAINSSFDNQFNNDFYKQRRQGFLDYATPQLEDQFSKTRKDLTYWLDGRGLLDSSIRADKEAELQKLYDTNARAVNDQALNYETQARDRVSTARSGLIRDLQSSGDASGASQAALSRASALSTPDTYSPLADMFGSFTDALATQAKLEQGAHYSNGAIKPGLGHTGLFAPNPNAVKNT